MTSKVIFVFAALALAGCQKVEEDRTVSTESTGSVNYTLSKKCNDGTDVYLVDGQYATWDGTNEQWIMLSPDVTPDDYCN